MFKYVKKENTEKKNLQDNHDTKHFSNETTIKSCDSIFSKKMQIQQSENNEILYSDFFEKKSDGIKINGNFKTEEIPKQINPFENFVEENENKINTVEKNNPKGHLRSL